MKKFQEVISSFLINWTGPELSYLKRGGYYFYSINQLHYYLKFKQIPMYFTPLQVEVWVGFENIAISKTHADCLQVKYHTLKFPTFYENVGLWAMHKKSAFFKKKKIGGRKNYGSFGWKFNSDDDFDLNVLQMVAITKAAHEELYLHANSPDFLQSLLAISDDGNGFHEWPRYFLQLAELYVNKDRVGLVQKLAKIQHHEQGTVKVITNYYEKKLSEI